MPKNLPALDSALLLPPLSLEQYSYFQNADLHPFDASASSLSLCNAWWLADSAFAAYTDESTATKIFAAGGLTLAEGGAVSGSKRGGRCYIAADDAKIIVSFRGTQVLANTHLTNPTVFREQVSIVLRDLGTDALAMQVDWNGRAGGRVHRGFAESCSEMLPAIKTAIERLCIENPARKLWLTGHSLGGALATLAADVLENVQGIATFGSPQIGDSTFAEALQFKGARFRNHSDIIAWAPSEALGYRHGGSGLYFDRR